MYLLDIGYSENGANKNFSQFLSKSTSFSSLILCRSSRLLIKETEEVNIWKNQICIGYGQIG